MKKLGQVLKQMILLKDLFFLKYLPKRRDNIEKWE